ncbi:Uncharacterised protein [Raoultella terrigena]|uniref:Uncharacterized protein n=1 Tax=Raoultella terrigena TaxID=577 RepID=A0A4U9CV51_RAOTE|nr:Uncharacterised protein [Raoultella terrigena]
MDALKHHASGGRRVGNVAPCRIVQHGHQTLHHRTVIAQKFRKGNRPGAAIAIQHAVIKAELAAKRGVEAGRIDAERLCQVGNADRVIAPRVKKVLRNFNGLQRIKLTRASRGAALFCSIHYITP